VITVSDNNVVQGDPNWERKVLEKLALESIAEQRRGRRWGIFFKLTVISYLVLLLGIAMEWWGTERIADLGRHTALVRLDGVIQAKGDSSAENIIGALQAAYQSPGTAGVVLRINSPGGSPVQAGMIFDEIKRLRGLHAEVPLYVVIEDVCASGGYYVAAAADKIYVDKASIVGSIGVLMDGFGFTGTMEKLGVERRVMHAGENKVFLDPFSPVNDNHKAHAQVMLGEIHQQFIDTVKKGRGNRLKETPDMFSGLMWSGAKSIELGLADAYGSLDIVARDVIKAEEIRDYTVQQNLAEKFAKQFGAGAAASIASSFGAFSLR
jgi:protease IV